MWFHKYRITIFDHIKVTSLFSQKASIFPKHPPEGLPNFKLIPLSLPLPLLHPQNIILKPPYPKKRINDLPYISQFLNAGILCKFQDFLPMIFMRNLRHSRFSSRILHSGARFKDFMILGISSRDKITENRINGR